MLDVILSLFKYLGLGLVALIVLALVFGKRIRKKWEYEAEFRDEKGREFGEFDIELSRIEKDEPNYTLKADFHMRHEALGHLQTVQVYIDELLILEGLVTEAGRVRLGNDRLQNEISDAPVGGICRIVCDGQELFRQEMVRD